MKKFLGFNTLGENLEAVLFSETSIIDSKKDLSGKMQNEILGEFLRDFLQENNLKYANLDFLVFLNGPSSFMKVRNALSHGLGVEFALKPKIRLLNFNLFQIYESIIKQNFDFKNFLIILKGFSESVFIWDSKNQKAEMIKIYDLKNFFLENNFFQQEFNFFFDSEEILSKIKENIMIPDQKSQVFSSFYSDPLINQTFFIIKDQLKNGEINESFFEIKPFYLFNPEFKKINI